MEFAVHPQKSRQNLIAVHRIKVVTEQSVPHSFRTVYLQIIRPFTFHCGLEDQCHKFADIVIAGKNSGIEHIYCLLNLKELPGLKESS